MIDPAWEPAGAVIAYAAANGETVTKEQLARWHRAGLIPQPQTRHRTAQRGTESIYPPDTAVQAVAASRALRRERNLVRAAFRLWWDGRPIGASVPREFAEKIAADLDGGAREFAVLVDGSGELTAQGHAQLADLSAAPSTIRRVHRRMSMRGNDPEAFAHLAAAMVRLAVRGDSAAPAADAALIDHGVGLDERCRLPIAEARSRREGPPHAEPEAMQGVFAPGRLVELVEKASDGALADSRDTAKTLIANLLSLASVLRAIDPPWGAGFGLLDEALGKWTERAEGLCAVLLIVLALSEREELLRGIEELRQPMEEWSSTGLRSWQQLDMLRHEVPEVRRILTPARLRKALRSPTELERLQDDVGKAHKRYGDKIDAVAVAHPELFSPDSEPVDST